MMETGYTKGKEIIKTIMERLNELFYAHMMEYHADITNYAGRELLVVCESACVKQCLMKTV